MSYEEKFALAEASGEEGCFARIDETNPVGIFLGVESGQRAVMVLCAQRPPDSPSLAAIYVDSRARSDGQWALILRLVRPELKALFTRLVEDLDGATRQQPQDPGGVVISRLARWQRLFSRGSTGVLEDNALRGLAAELDFLLNEAIPAVGLRAAIAAWHGPYEAPKDFAFDQTDVEVKAIQRQSREIVITSLEQLTDTEHPLFLWTRVVDLVPAQPGDPNTFAALVSRVRASVAHDPGPAEALEKALGAAGYEDRPEYNACAVRLGPASCFRVRDEFPRLQRTQVTPGVVACSYSVAVTNIEPFRVENWREGLPHG